jgi:hypothetical protein
MRKLQGMILDVYFLYSMVTASLPHVADDLGIQLLLDYSGTIIQFL